MSEHGRAVAGVAQQRDLVAATADELGDAPAVGRQRQLARGSSEHAARGVVVDHGVHRIASRDRQHADRRMVDVNEPGRDRERFARQRRSGEDQLSGLELTKMSAWVCAASTRSFALATRVMNVASGT